VYYIVGEPLLPPLAHMAELRELAFESGKIGADVMHVVLKHPFRIFVFMVEQRFSMMLGCSFK